MGYLFLSVALLTGAVKGYCGKRMGSCARDTRSAVMLNLLRMALCVLFGLLMIFFLGQQGQLRLSGKLIGISLLSGVSTAVFVVSWLLAVRKSAYMLLDVFLMLGTLLPMLLGRLLFQESIAWHQWLGYGVLLCAVMLLCAYNNTVKVRLNASSLLLLIVSGAANGAADFSQKLFVKALPGTSAAVFNLYTYVFAGLTLLLIVLLLPHGEKEDGKGARRGYAYIAVMAAALILNSYFKTLSASHLSSAQLYPLNQGMGLILSSLMAHFLFRERLTKRAIGGIALAFAGLMIMNML